ncbi:histone acetyltransferase KAT6B-like isoform X2 [Anopheles merus]|uniref:histone acetyltransferase KAT6B-like isoform X2 n=1 Tax=Anopheles merus TaxID=30066 RepID=UPI001BE40E0E|nr:histone acetyltransferase KAT6B-like isoform X2 [Anopheles merus]
MLENICRWRVRFNDPQKVTDCLISFAKHKTRDNITVIIVFLKDPQTIIKETPFIEQIEAKARLRSSQNMEINGAASNGFLAENNAIGMEDHKTYDDIQNFMVESAMLEPKSAASTLCVGPMDDMGFLSDGGLGPETDVDGVHDSKQQSPSPLLEEAVKSAQLLDNGDMLEHEAAHGADSGAEEPQHHTMDHHNPFAQSLNVPLDLAPSGMGEAANTTDYEEEEPTSPSSLSAADPPVDLSEEDQLVHAVPHVNGNGEHHHYDELTETIGDELVGGGDGGDGASEKLDAAEIVPALKAELNADELVPLKTIDEPIVNDLLGADAIVDNKLIDQLDSFGIPEAIRRQLIEQQQVSGGAAMLHEHDEDDDDGQLMMGEEKQSDFDGADDGAEKEDLHHEKVFDSDYGTDRHSADVKQDDDAGCCEDSEEDEWDYVKVNSEEQQQQQQHEQESQPAPEKQPEESTPSDETTLPVEYSSSISNSFAPEEPLQQENDVLQQQEPVQEVEQQHFEEQQQQQEEEVEVNCEEEEQQQVEQTPAQESNEEEEDGVAGGRVVAEHHDEVAAVPNTNEPAAAVADILGDYAAESTVSESANEVDDVISSTGGETKEVVNLLNDFNEDVLPPTADAPVCDTNSETVNEEETSEPVVPAYDLPSDSVNMEASMYGGSVGDQPHSPETPMSPVENFPAQQQQQQQQYSHEKDMFGSGMDDTMSPTTDGEELNEKHLYETEEKSMNLLQQQQQQQDGSGGGDYGWSLNPEAKEFVPVTGSVGGGGAEINPKMHELREDAIVAQSPRKGTMSSMEDLDVPAETDFQTEMDKRPHEFEEYGGENGENGGADESGAGESHLRSPLAVHPFDLSEFNEQTVVEQQLLAGSGDMANGVGDYENAGVDLLAQPAVADADAEMELLNKVQELPDDEEEKPQEPLVDAQEVAPVQAQYAHEEFDQLVKPEETYSAKEELSVEQKETVDISPSSVDLAHQMDNLMLEGGEMYHGRVEDYPADQVPRGASSDISQSPEFKMLQSSIEQQLGKTSGSSSPFAGGESELAAYHKEASALEASVYDPEPGLLSSQEPAASVDSSEPQASQNYIDLMGGAPDQKADPEPMVEAAKPQETAEMPAEPEQTIASDDKKAEEPQVAEAEKESADVAGTAVAAAAAAATVAVAAAAATAAATSKPTAKPKAPSTTAAKKTTASAKPSASAAVYKDSTATKSAATRVGSSSTTTTAARKPLAKAPTSSSGPAAARTTTGKPSTDATKAAPATKTTASSVAAARTKAASATSTTKTATSATSTTKAASASSVTRTAAPKPATGSAGAAPKPSSRLSTASSTTTRTVTSRPSSAVSSASVPSKTSTTTTTTAKRTVAAKSSLTNGTSATDGAAARTTKTTTSSTVPRTGAATRTSASAGSGLAGKTSSSGTTAAAKKPLLDAKTTASKTASSSTAAGRTTTTTRTSLAPKAATAGATSPSVRKVQQNGVAAKKSTTSAVSPAPGTKKPAPITRPKGTATTAAAAPPAAAKTNGVVGTVTEAAVPVDAAAVAATSPPEQPEQHLPADQLLVPVPQAM